MLTSLLKYAFFLSNKFLTNKLKRMKKLTSLLILMILSSSVLFAQMHTPEQIAQKKMNANGIKPVMSVVDADINAVTNPHATSVTDDLFDPQFDFICGDASGEAGIETNGDYIYTSMWNADGFQCYEMDGTWVGWFPVAGEAAVRDLAYDGTYFYGAAASTALFEMDFVGQSGTLISTLTAAVATRACGYNPDYDAFYGNNWSDPITLYDRTGGILNQFNVGAYSSYYGFAWLNDAGTPWLYGFSQAGGASAAVIVQIDPETGAETGVTFDANVYSTTGAASAGGLASFDSYAPGWWTLLGILQNETIFGVEGGIAGPPPDLDLKLTGISEPNTGFGLGIEDVVIGVKNAGAITQSNFDVQYRVDGGAWYTEMIAGPLAMGESIVYTFNQAYDFSAFGEYYIEAEVILAGDEHPENNSGDKTIENWDPSAWCEYSLTMWDSYGDGWNGNTIQIFGDGVEYVNATIATGYGPETVYFNVGDGAFLTAVFTGTAWPEECTYEVYDSYGELIFADGPNPTGGDIGFASCTPPPPIDGGTVGIISPESGMLLGIEPVTVIFKNFGSDPLPDIPVGFNLDGAGWVYETVPGPVGPGEEVEYTFTATVDLTELGTYFIEVCTFVPNDEDPDNDCMDKEIENVEGMYCDASTVTEDEWIAFVDFGLIQNASGWQGGVADYTDQFNNVAIGVPAEMIVTNGNAWASDKVSVWCDWNNDFEFDDLPGSIEKYVLANDGTGAVFTGDITAPVGALGGPHRMRVRMTYSVDPEPCGESSYGEVEDYTIIIGDVVPPEITWDPDLFNVFLEEGETAQEFLTIGNIGEGFLLWEIDIDPPAETWLIVSPLTGMIDPQGSENVTLAFDASAYPAGTVLTTDLVLSSNDTLNPEIIIPVTMTINSPPEPHFIFEGGDPSSPLWTIYIGGATLNNSDTDLEAYDEIAIFDGDVMVGAFILEQVCTPENQFENDLTAFSVLVSQPGYQAGNAFTFKCWDCSEQVEADVFLYEFFNPYGDAYVGDVFPSEDGPYSIAAIDFYSIAAQTFNLGFGFQFISSAVDPPEPDMLVVMADVLNDNLDFARNTFGQMLRKIGPNWVNGIGDWIVEEGYLVKMNADDSFTINGILVDPTTPIDVMIGFTFVSYYPTAPMDALVAFATIIGDDLDFIRDSQGQTLRKIGPIWVNGIGDAAPGEGYLVKMFAAGDIIYPAAAKSSGKTTAVPSHLIFEGGNPAEAVYTLYIEGLEIGDEVAAYNGDVILGSMTVISNSVYENDLPIFSQLVSGQGYVAGEPILLKVWSNDNVAVAEFEMESVYNSYVSNVYPSNDGEYSVVNMTKGATIAAELVIYPNPATNMVNISTPNQIKNVVIFNYVGQSVYEGNSSQINTSNFEAGIYIIRIETTNGIETQKVTIK